MTEAGKEYSQNKLRIALLVDSKIDSKYVYELAEWAQTQNDLEITHLLIQNVPSGRSKIQKAFLLLKKRRLLYLMQAVGFSFIEKLESI